MVTGVHRLAIGHHSSRSTLKTEASSCLRQAHNYLRIYTVSYSRKIFHQHHCEKL